MSTLGYRRLGPARPSTRLALGVIGAIAAAALIIAIVHGGIALGAQKTRFKHEHPPRNVYIFGASENDEGNLNAISSKLTGSTAFNPPLYLRHTPADFWQSSTYMAHDYNMKLKLGQDCNWDQVCTGTVPTLACDVCTRWPSKIRATGDIVVMNVAGARTADMGDSPTTDGPTSIFTSTFPGQIQQLEAYLAYSGRTIQPEDMCLLTQTIRNDVFNALILTGTFVPIYEQLYMTASRPSTNGDWLSLFGPAGSVVTKTKANVEALYDLGCRRMLILQSTGSGEGFFPINIALQDALNVGAAFAGDVYPNCTMPVKPHYPVAPVGPSNDPANLQCLIHEAATEAEANNRDAIDASRTASMPGLDLNIATLFRAGPTLFAASASNQPPSLGNRPGYNGDPTDALNRLRDTDAIANSLNSLFFPPPLDVNTGTLPLTTTQKLLPGWLPTRESLSNPLITPDGDAGLNAVFNDGIHFTSHTSRTIAHAIGHAVFGFETLSPRSASVSRTVAEHHTKNYHRQTHSKSMETDIMAKVAGTKEHVAACIKKFNEYCVANPTVEACVNMAAYYA